MTSYFDLCSVTTYRSSLQSEPRDRLLLTRTRRPIMRVIAVALACSLSIACTSMKPISVAEAAAPVLKAGDTVRITTRDGLTWRVVVERVDANVIVARDGARFDRSEIAAISRRSAHGGRTALLVAAIVVGTFVVLVAGLAASGACAACLG